MCVSCEAGDRDQADTGPIVTALSQHIPSIVIIATITQHRQRKQLHAVLQSQNSCQLAEALLLENE